MNLTLAILLEAVCTFAIWSYLYKENPIYRLFEYVFIGISVGHILVMSISSINGSAIVPLLAGNVLYIIPIILGFTLYFYFSRSFYYLYRIPMALLVGTGVGLGIRGAAHSTIINQTIANISMFKLGMDWLSLLKGLAILVGSVSVLYYFIFTYYVEQKGAIKNAMRLPRYFIMLTFGALLANVVMVRTSYLSGRLIFLWTTDAIYLIPVAIVIFALGILYDNGVLKIKKK
jgi:hypothetical protein